MILFKACPRCRGDVDATYPEDAFCIQCSYRPAVAFPGPRVIEPAAPTFGSPPSGPNTGPATGWSESRPAAGHGTVGERTGTGPCPRCGSGELIRLDKLRPQDNTCYRCRPCGHVFSPVIAIDSDATSS